MEQGEVYPLGQAASEVLATSWEWRYFFVQECCFPLAQLPVNFESAAPAREPPMFNEVLGILQKCPPARYEQGDDFVRVLPVSEQGFEVVIEQIWEGHFAVSFGGWREDFYTLEEALDCFSLGLSNRCRLKVQSRDGVPYRWTVECWDEPVWRERTTKSKWNYKILTPAAIAYLQNDLLAECEIHSAANKLADSQPQTEVH